MLQGLQQTEQWGEFTAINFQELGLVSSKLVVGYSHAAQLILEFVCPDQNTPIPQLAYIIVWDEGSVLDDGSTEQSAEHPLFEGYVEYVGPDGPDKVSLIAMDATYRASKTLTIMSAPWQAGTIPHTPPVEAVGAVPRLVYNVISQSDSDWPFSRGQFGATAQIVAGLLTDQANPLLWLNAAPMNEDGTAAQPYVTDDIFPWGDSIGMSFVPEEKIVWESESIRAGIDRMQRYEPRFRTLFVPGERLWRFWDLTLSPSVMLRLNDPTVTYPVLSMQLKPSLDKCYTAIQFFGPPATETNEYIWYDPSVIPDGSTNTLQTVGPAYTLEWIGPDPIQTYQCWQIVDPTERRGARELPNWYACQISQYAWQPTMYPMLFLSWDAGNTWISSAGAWLDWQNGSATFPVTAPYITVEQQYGQTASVIGQHYFPPNAVKLVWATYITPLYVREPASGFTGTAYTIGGLELVKDVYDESLSIGVEYGTPVTSAYRIAQFQALANCLLAINSNITWVGGCVLDGIDYSWLRLNRTVNFSANDGMGGTVTTGWGSINAYVTDVEYDYVNRTTTLTFSSDRAELIGEDVAQMKQELGIRALIQRTWSQEQLLFRTDVGFSGQQFQELSGVQVSGGFRYVDPWTGRTVATDQTY